MNRYYSDQEVIMAEQMMMQIRESGKLYPDPIVTDYIQQIGNRLSQAHDTQKPLHFFVLNDPRINAFSGPAGYIGVNSGLILESESESELASVLAHEIAHATQGHLKQNIDAAGRANMHRAASMLAAIALGVIDPALATGALAVGMAGTQQQLLNFSREHEFEADQIGIKILNKARYEPEAMIAFFNRLSHQERYYDRPPELLLTHPFTEERIAQASSRIARMQPQLAKPHPQFSFIRERVRVYSSEKPHDLVSHYQRLFKQQNAANKSAIQYGYALALLHSHQTTTALNELKPLIESSPQNPMFLAAAGLAEFEMGHDSNAINYLKKAHQAQPENFAYIYNYVKVLIDTENAEQGLTVLKTFLRNHPDNLDAYDLLAHGQAKTGNLVAAYQTRAKLFLAYKDYTGAIDQLNSAKQENSITNAEKTAIEAQINALTAKL